MGIFAALPVVPERLLQQVVPLDHSLIGSLRSRKIRRQVEMVEENQLLLLRRHLLSRALCSAEEMVTLPVVERCAVTEGWKRLW